MKLLYVLVAVPCLLLSACAGNDPLKVDKIPPDEPLLIKHIGDTGDGMILSEYSPDSIFVTDDNNGIDAESDGDWIKLQWNHLTDNDLSAIKIYRYATGYPAVEIESILPDREYYIDRLSNTGGLNARETVWNYYIKPIDRAGNFSISDTVSYRLINKAQLISPYEDALLDNSNITFNFIKSGPVSKLRLLVFDEYKQYIWHRDIYVTEDNSFSAFYDGENLGNGIYYWRVDSFGDSNEEGIFLSGSESKERKFTIE